MQVAQGQTLQEIRKSDLRRQELEAAEKRGWSGNGEATPLPGNQGDCPSPRSERDEAMEQGDWAGGESEEEPVSPSQSVIPEEERPPEGTVRKNFYKGLDNDKKRRSKGGGSVASAALPVTSLSAGAAGSGQARSQRMIGSVLELRAEEELVKGHQDGVIQDPDIADIYEGSYLDVEGNSGVVYLSLIHI